MCRKGVQKTKWAVKHDMSGSAGTGEETPEQDATPGSETAPSAASLASGSSAVPFLGWDAKFRRAFRRLGNLTEFTEKYEEQGSKVS